MISGAKRGGEGRGGEGGGILLRNAQCCGWNAI